MGKKKASGGFKTEKTIEERRRINKETFLMEAIIVGIGSLYLLLNKAAYSFEHPRADFITALTGSLEEILKNPFYFWPINYPFMGELSVVALIVMFIFLQYNYTKFRIHSSEDVGGKTVWGNPKDITHRYADVIKKQGILPFKFLEIEDPEPAYNNTMMSKNLWASMDAEKHFHALNTLIVGASGSGKTRFWLKPNLLQMNCSYAITDPKGEILDSCGEILRRNGYDIKVFDVTFQEGKPSRCNMYNPLKYCKQESDVKKIINAFVKNTSPDGGKGGGSKDPFWEDSMSTLLSAIIALLCIKPKGSTIPYGQIKEIVGEKGYLPCFPNVIELVRMSGKKYTQNSGIPLMEGAQMEDSKSATAAGSELGAIFENLRVYEATKVQGYDLEDMYKMEKPYCLREWEGIYKTPEKTFETIKTTATTRLDPFNIQQIKNITADDNINLEDFPKKKTALFLIMSATDKTYNFLLSFLYTQLFDMLYRFGETRVDGSKYITLQNGELIKWFSKEEIKEYQKENNSDLVSDMLDIYKGAYIKPMHQEKREDEDGREYYELVEGDKYYLHGQRKGKKGKKEPFDFDDSWYEIYAKDDDGNDIWITRRAKKSDAEAFLKDIQNAKIVKGVTPKLPIHYRFLIDEFPNIGEIPEFKEKLATMRGYAISATVICQSITQLKGMYPDDYEVIDANCPFFVFLGGDENSNNEYVAKKIGKTTAKGLDNSIGSKKDISSSLKTENVELMRAEDIGRIAFSQSLVFIYGEMPILDDKYDFVDHKNYKMSKEYLMKCGLDAMCFDRDNYKVNLNTQITIELTSSSAIPAVNFGDTNALIEAMKSLQVARDEEELLDNVEVNTQRFTFEDASKPMNVDDLN